MQAHCRGRFSERCMVEENPSPDSYIDAGPCIAGEDLVKDAWLKRIHLQAIYIYGIETKCPE